MRKREKKFEWQGMITFVLTLFFLVQIVSGITLYIAPHGRIANWTSWTVWWLDKEEWSAIHTIFGFLLLFAAILHLYFNWKIFANYIWSKMRKVLNLRWELGTALLINLAVFATTLWNLPPFSTTMNIGEAIKESWEESRIKVPIPRLETLSLHEASVLLQLPLDQMISALQAKNYNVGKGDQIIRDIAKEKGVSPATLYEDMTSVGPEPLVPQTIEGTGLGKRTLEAIGSERGLSLDVVLSRLKEKGIEAKGGDRLSQVSVKYGKSPQEILNIIEVKE